jgi:hypothetical protein
VTRPRWTKAPLAVAGLLAFPLFLASLMAASLAIERPQAIQWQGPHNRLIEVDHPPSDVEEAKIWLLALVPPAILLLVGLASSFLGRVGLYTAAAAAIVLALALPQRLDRWAAHHAIRFPFGVDLVPDTSPSSTTARGEWEQSARETVLSLTHWTIGLALAVIVIAAAFRIRRRRGVVRAPVAPPPPEAAVVGAPTTARAASWRRWFWP